LSRVTPKQRERSANAIRAIEKTTTEVLQFVENIMIWRDDDAAFESVDLVSVADALVRFFRSQPRFQNVSFELEADEDFPRSLLLKEEQIRRVLVNLVVNAAEVLTGDSPVRENPSVRVKLSRAEDKESVFVEVIDNGPGFTEENRARAFINRFTTKKDGHGIGLVSVARIVQLHDGDVAVESSPGNGATFRIRLPLKEVLVG